MRNKGLIQQYPVITTMLLNQCMKRALKNEGLNEENDDIFRPLNAKHRQKLIDLVSQREEILYAVNTVVDHHLDRLYADKLGSLFSFVVKTQVPITTEQIQRIFRQFKKLIIMYTNADFVKNAYRTLSIESDKEEGCTSSNEGEEDMLSDQEQFQQRRFKETIVSMCIMLRLSSKFIQDQDMILHAKDSAKVSKEQRAEAIARKKAAEGMLTFSLPFIEQYHPLMSISLVSMALKSVDKVHQITPEFITKVIKEKREKFNVA